MTWKEQLTFEVKVLCSRLWQSDFHLDNCISGNDSWVEWSLRQRALHLQKNGLQVLYITLLILMKETVKHTTRRNCINGLPLRPPAYLCEKLPFRATTIWARISRCHRGCRSGEDRSACSETGKHKYLYYTNVNCRWLFINIVTNVSSNKLHRSTHRVLMCRLLADPLYKKGCHRCDKWFRTSLGKLKAKYCSWCLYMLV